MTSIELRKCKDDAHVGAPVLPISAFPKDGHGGRRHICVQCHRRKRREERPRTRTDETPPRRQDPPDPSIADIRAAEAKAAQVVAEASALLSMDRERVASLAPKDRVGKNRRRAISVADNVYVCLKREAVRRGVSMSSLVEEAIGKIDGVTILSREELEAELHAEYKARLRRREANRAREFDKAAERRRRAFG